MHFVAWRVARANTKEWCPRGPNAPTDEWYVDDGRFLSRPAGQAVPRVLVEFFLSFGHTVCVRPLMLAAWWASMPHATRTCFRVVSFLALPGRMSLLPGSFVDGRETTSGLLEGSRLLAAYSFWTLQAGEGSI